jgi:hypothetical protein
VRKLACFAVVLLIFTGCTDEKSEGSAPATTTVAEVKPPAPPDAAAAATLISSSAEFSEFEFTNAGYSLPLSATAMNEPAREVAKELVATKWISIKGDKVVLSSKAETDRRFLVRPNGFVDLVPLAKKEFVAVTALEPQADGTVAANFTWKWIPNDIGESFRKSLLHDRYAGERQATAALMWDGSAWTVLRITKRG